MTTKDKAREAFADFNAAMQSLDNTAKNLAIGCMQSYSNEIWNAVEQAKAGYQAATEANKEAMREVSELIKNTDFHYGTFMDVNDCADFCREEKLAALRNLLLALGEQEQAITKLKQLIGDE